jgi:ABC-2 type transport system permease protein
MSRLQGLLINPVLNKEIKLRFRSIKGFLGILFYLIALGAIALGFIYINSMNGSSGYMRPEESRNMFIVLSMMQMGLIIFMTPGLTAGVISGERERQTLNMLLTTQQSSTSIILSKLFSSIAYLLVMMVASIPLYSIVFLYGGISPSFLLSAFGIYLITIITIGSLGIMFSTIIQKTIVAMITTYGVALFLTAGLGVLTIFLMEMFHRPGVANSTFIDPYFSSMLNPAIVLFSLFESELERELFQRSGIEISLWIGFVLCYVLITILALFVSITKLRPRMNRYIRTKKVKQDE